MGFGLTQGNVNLVRYLQWARKHGEVVHISQVERGAACQCVCDECGSPLIARQGSQRAHSFAHENSDCQGNQETLLHLKAKEIIEESKRLTVMGSKGNQEVIFDCVEVEQQVGPYRVDVIGVKDGRRCLVEIAVTHPCSLEKVQYFKDNKLAVVEISIDSCREFRSMDEYAEYVVAGAARRWISNSVLKQELPGVVMTIDHERIREMQEQRDRCEPVFLAQLKKAVGQRTNQPHYGTLVEADLRGYGIPNQRLLCVDSKELPREYGYFGMVLWHYTEMRKYLGREVRFDIIYDYEQSIYLKTYTLFPQVVIRKVKGVSDWDLSAEIGTRRWRKKGYTWI